MSLNTKTAVHLVVGLVVLSGSLVIAQHMDLPPVSKGGELAYVRDFPSDGLETAAAGEHLTAKYVGFTVDEHESHDLLYDFESRGRIADSHLLHRIDAPQGTFDNLSWVQVDHVERGVFLAEGPTSCFASLNGVNAGTALIAKAPGQARYLVLNEYRLEQVDGQTVEAHRDGHVYRFQVDGAGNLSLDGQNLYADLAAGDQLRGWIVDEYPATTKVMHGTFDHLGEQCSVAASEPVDEPDQNETEPAGDVAVDKSVARQDEEVVTYDILTSSVGEADAEQVTMVDELPTGGSEWFIGGPDADACSLDDNVLVCDFGTVPTGEDRLVNATVYVRDLCGPFENTATASASNDADSSNDSDNATAELPPCDEEPETADIDVNKTVLAQDDETVTFLVSLYNHGPATAVGDGVYLNDTLPEVSGEWFIGGEDAEACSTSGFSHDHDEDGTSDHEHDGTANQVVCHWFEVPAGEEVSFTARGYVRDLCGELSNTATGWAENDVSPENNEATAVADLGPCETPDVAVNKTVHSQDEQQVTFRIEVESVGSLDADNVSMSDELPETHDEWFLGGADSEHCSLDGNSLACDFGTLAVGERRSVTVKSYVDEACGTLENTATVSADDDSDASNDASTATAELAPCEQEPDEGNETETPDEGNETETPGEGNETEQPSEGNETQVPDEEEDESEEEASEEPEQEFAEPRTQGYWKNHPEAWPVDELTLGGETYTKQEALELFDTPPRGDASVILAHQLMAAKLNVANGADGSTIQSTIDDADAALADGGRLPQGVHASSEAGQDMTELSETLDAWNNGGEEEDDLSPQALMAKVVQPSYALALIGALVLVGSVVVLVRRK